MDSRVHVQHDWKSLHMKSSFVQSQRRVARGQPVTKLALHQLQHSNPRLRFVALRGCDGLVPAPDRLRLGQAKRRRSATVARAAEPAQREAAHQQVALELRIGVRGVRLRRSAMQLLARASARGPRDGRLRAEERSLIKFAADADLTRFTRASAAGNRVRTERASVICSKSLRAHKTGRSIRVPRRARRP